MMRCEIVSALKHVMRLHVCGLDVRQGKGFVIICVMMFITSL